MRSGALKTLTANLKYVFVSVKGRPEYENEYVVEYEKLIVVFCFCRKSSHLLSKSESGSKRDAPNLPSLASIDWGEELLPAGLREYSPLPMVGGLAQFVAVMLTHSVDSSEEVSKPIL